MRLWGGMRESTSAWLVPVLALLDEPLARYAYVSISQTTPQKIYLQLLLSSTFHTSLFLFSQSCLSFLHYCFGSQQAAMAPIALETEDHSRDAAFNQVMHGNSADEKAGFRAMLGKDHAAQKAAVDEYFKHWDNKAASTETTEVREVQSQRHNKILIEPSLMVSYRRVRQNMPRSPDSTLLRYRHARDCSR